MRARLAALLVTAASAGCGAMTGMKMDDFGVDAPVDAGIDAPPPPPDVDAGCTGAVRQLRIGFTPTKHVQLAIFATSEGRFATIGLTAATARYGIGNRPAAMDMNSGYHWPKGRREGVLPVWAHARVDAGGSTFPRVIYRNRVSEGYASQSPVRPSDPYHDTVDPYFCLPFRPELSDRDHLDAVACASTMNSDKGRYLTADDAAAGYAEPYEDPAGAGMHALSTTSLYPPRVDYVRTDGDHPDVARYADDAHAAMPELDAVTMATPAADRPFELVWPVPSDWSCAPIDVRVEASTEGDYDDAWGPTQYPTPTLPGGAWDTWAIDWGYPYRGQPSVVYELTVDSTTLGAHSVAAPTVYSHLDGTAGTTPIDSTISDDPTGAPGSGADRLRMRASGDRLTVTVERR